jgi:hypothetical protein
MTSTLSMQQRPPDVVGSPRERAGAAAAGESEVSARATVAKRVAPAVTAPHRLVRRSRAPYRRVGVILASTRSLAGSSRGRCVVPLARAPGCSRSRGECGRTGTATLDWSDVHRAPGSRRVSCWTLGVDRLLDARSERAGDGGARGGSSFAACDVPSGSRLRHRAVGLLWPQVAGRRPARSAPGSCARYAGPGVLA